MSDANNFNIIKYGCAGGASTATPTNTSTSTSTATPTNSSTDTATATPTNTVTNSPTSTPTNTITDTPTMTPTNTITNTPTNSSTYTSTNTVTNSPTSTPTNTVTNTPTITSTNTITNTPTITPTNTITNTPTNTPVSAPVTYYISDYAGGGSKTSSGVTALQENLSGLSEIGLDTLGNVYVLQNSNGEGRIAMIDTNGIYSTIKDVQGVTFSFLSVTSDNTIFCGFSGNYVPAGSITEGLLEFPPGSDIIDLSITDNPIHTYTSMQISSSKFGFYLSGAQVVPLTFLSAVSVMGSLPNLPNSNFINLSYDSIGDNILANDHSSIYAASASSIVTPTPSQTPTSWSPIFTSGSGASEPFKGAASSSVPVSFGAGHAIGQDGSGNYYWINELNGKPYIDRLGTDGKVWTIAGNGTKGHTGVGLALNAAISPLALSVASDGNIYFTDSNGYVRKLSQTAPSGLQSGSTIVGTNGATLSTPDGAVQITLSGDNGAYAGFNLEYDTDFAAQSNGVRIQAQFSSHSIISAQDLGSKDEGFRPRAADVSNAPQTTVNVAPLKMLSINLIDTSGQEYTGTFSTPATITFEVAPSVAAAVKNRTLSNDVVYYQNTDGTWAPASTTGEYFYVDATHISVSTNHFSTWALLPMNFYDSSTAGGNNILGPVPVNSGGNIYLFTDTNTSNNLAGTTWDVYSVAGVHVANVNYSGSSNQYWNTQGIARGLYYVKLTLKFIDGSSKIEWHKVIVQ